MDQPLTRDVVVLFKGDAYPVRLDPDLQASGWQGGQGVQWVDGGSEFTVGVSDGLYGGFLLWGSNEPSDQYIAMVGQQVAYGYGILCCGGWLIATRTFERYTYASRQLGPLVEIPYQSGQRLRFSLRGWVTTEDEWALSGDPRGSNGYLMANVVMAPRFGAANVPYLTIQTSI